MTDLSPAAQAVLDAIKSELDHAPWELSYLAGSSAAAALRAAADQVVPVTSSRTAAAAGKRCARAELLAIATELEGAQ